MSIIFLYTVINFNSGVKNNTYASVTGIVDDYYYYSADSNYSKVVLRNLNVNGKNAAGNLELSINTNSQSMLEFIRQGYEFSFNADLKVIKIIDNNALNVDAYIYNTRFSAVVQENNLVIMPKTNTGIYSLRQKIANTIKSRMSAESASVVIAIILGNKTEMAQSTKTTFSALGLAHTLAVSGLHIGIIVGVLIFLLRLIKTPKKIIHALVIVATFFYAYLTDFSPSVMRAFIMTAVSLTAHTYGKRYDILNSLGLAASVILVISPLYLFNIGFQLSCAAVLGIALFSKGVAKQLTKIKLPKKIVETVAITVSALIITMPLVAIYFNTLQVYSVFSNVVLLPILVALFVAALFCVALSLMFSPLGVLLTLIGIILDKLLELFNALIALPMAQILFWPPAIYLLFVVPLVFMISRFMFNDVIKKLAFIIVVVNLGLFFGLGFNIKDTTSNAIIPFGNNLSNSILYSETGSSFIVTNTKTLDANLKQLKMPKVNYGFIFNTDKLDVNEIKYIKNTYNTGTLYFSTTAEPSILQKLKNNGVKVVILDKYALEKVDNFYVSAVYGFDDKFMGFSFFNQQVKIFMTNPDENYYALNADFLNSFDVIRSSFSISGFNKAQIVDYNFLADAENVVVKQSNATTIYDYITNTVKVAYYKNM